MNIQTQLLNTTLIIALSCFYQFVKAQIVFTDVNPDTVIGDYSIDINGDGTNDFTLNQAIVTGYMVKIASVSVTALNENKIAVGDSLSDYPGYPLALGEGINISELGLLSFTAGGTMRYQYSNQPALGFWKNDIVKYLGVKLFADGSIFYGWIRLSVYAKGTIPAAHETLISYAYNSNPNQPILAGQTCPPQSVIFASGQTTFCAGDSVILSSANSGTNLTYKWKLNSNNISGATNKSYSANVAGKYKVNVKDNTNGCSATSALVKVKVPCRMINENLKGEENVLACYPNPFSQSTTISFSLPLSENVSFKILDVGGRLIRTFVNDVMSEGAHTLKWDARDENGNAVSAGIYFLKLTAGENSQIQKLIVTK